MPRKKTTKQPARAVPYTISQPAGGKISGKKQTKAKATSTREITVKEKRNKEFNTLFEKNTRNYGIGNAIQPKRDVTRFVRWPKYVRLQRQKRVLYHRLRVPPTIHQFTQTLNKNAAVQLFTLLDKYKPESKGQKKERLRKIAKALAKESKDAVPKTDAPKDGAAPTEGTPAATTTTEGTPATTTEGTAATKTTKGKKGVKPKKAVPKKARRPAVHYGINEVTKLAEQKRAQLVIIAHDVEPIELVIHLPAICRKLEIPYCIVKGKARLGQVVRKKTASSLALTNVSKDHEKELDNLREICLKNYNNNKDIVRSWGGKELGRKSLAALKKKRIDVPTAK